MYDKLVTLVPEVPCCHLKPKFFKVACFSVRILAIVMFVSCRESTVCFQFVLVCKIEDMALLRECLGFASRESDEP